MERYSRVRLVALCALALPSCDVVEAVIDLWVELSTTRPIF